MLEVKKEIILKNILNSYMQVYTIYPPKQ